MAKAAIAAANTEETSSGLGRLSASPARLMEFFRETRQEMHKVVVPSRSEVQTTTIVVLVTVFLFAAFFELVDLILGRGIDQLFLHLTKH
ncbi:MAG TPA: preprotein translocase subunit SecE [Acidobacteriaceae bacterium]|jgi:preprotein translocase subunit SecE|nr:preprotein translocase subunit SecE [Acidobacteriaceae bacterium]